MRHVMRLFRRPPAFPFGWFKEPPLRFNFTRPPLPVLSSKDTLMMSIAVRRQSARFGWAHPPAGSEPGLAPLIFD
jgi:hypothetical protein